MSFWKPTESSCTTFKRFYSFKLRLKPYNRGFLLEILKSRDNSWLEKKKRCFHFFFQVVSWTSKMQPKTIQKAFFFLRYFLKHDICCLRCPFQKMWECKASGEPWRNLSFSIIELLNSRESYRRWGKKKDVNLLRFPFLFEGIYFPWNFRQGWSSNTKSTNHPKNSEGTHFWKLEFPRCAMCQKKNLASKPIGAVGHQKIEVSTQIVRNKESVVPPPLPPKSTTTYYAKAINYRKKNATTN